MFTSLSIVLNASKKSQVITNHSTAQHCSWTDMKGSASNLYIHSSPRSNINFIKLVNNLVLKGKLRESFYDSYSYSILIDSIQTSQLHCTNTRNTSPKVSLQKMRAQICKVRYCVQFCANTKQGQSLECRKRLVVPWYLPQLSTLAIS